MDILLKIDPDFKNSEKYKRIKEIHDAELNGELLEEDCDTELINRFMELLKPDSDGNDSEKTL